MRSDDMTPVRILVTLFVAGLIFVGCSGNAYVPPTVRPPTATPTLLSTPLPTVSTQLPLGAASRAYHVALIAQNGNSNGSDLAKYLTDKLGAAFEVNVLPSASDVLRQLCSGPPTFAFLDGPGLLAAQAQNCGTPALKYEQGDANSTGVKADIIARAGAKDAVTALSGFKGRDFCRLNGQDVASWILPSLSLRAAGLNPALDLKGIKEFADPAAMLQAVADGLCAGASIPAGTLANYSPRLAVGQSLLVLQTTPEMPYGGLIVANTIPRAVAADVSAVLGKDPTELRSLISADALDKVGSNDYADFQRLAQAAGLSLKTLGQ